MAFDFKQRFGKKSWGAIASMVVLFGSLTFLLVDHLHWQRYYGPSQEALSQAEAAAQLDQDANDRYEQLVEQQTTKSLRFERRERVLGIIALVAAGAFVLFLRHPAPAKPALPHTLADCMPKRGDEEALPTAPVPETVPTSSPPPVDLEPVAEIVQQEGGEAHRLIPLLHAVQAEYRYLPQPVLDELCKQTDITPAQLAGVASFYTKFRTKPCGKHLVQLCRGTACHVAGADRVLEEMRRGLGIAPGQDTDPNGQATVETVGCLGCCSLAPAVQVDENILANVKVEDLPEIIDHCQDKPKKRSGYLPFRKPTASHSLDATSGELLLESDTARPRVITGDWEVMAADTLEEYERQGGFAALAKCLSQLTPDEVIDEVDHSGLRGRGGGGFPAAQKWRLVGLQSGSKYVIANGDEGDPGAFMDRSIMESAPARVLEGMSIAAFAVGATRGIVYVRNEYPLAVRRMRETVQRMREKGYLGDSILGSRFSLDIDVVEGAGAFICGEETALIQSVMGRRGIPHRRPPFPAESGLWARPTLVNNVETLACVPWILRHGSAQFATFGTEGSKGTKVFSLAGKVRHGGLVEAPMGTTIRELVEYYGRGVPAGRQFKAVQIGGPSGGCLPAALADTPIDYEALRELGAIMGSGGLVVLDDTDCMVDVARYFLEFTQHESCGHCTFCRIGTRKLLDLLEKLCAGKGSRRDLKEIESLAHSVSQGSLCGLGKTAPNPVLTTLKYFKDEYEAHLEGRCPAGRCKALIAYRVTQDCVGCTLCAQHCPVAAIEPTPYRQHWIDTDLCTCCDACRTTCPEKAIETVSTAKPPRIAAPPNLRKQPQLV
ncbi:NAD(P)H-dependent oxidoreductase subunit E [Aeoliella sp. ICT_H6.2]|uniref:NAD(P)H-dependent oxidoreductase subunit E n=1 Tax=Aeoliella straminimaris TaxID=2954799 RepID=A0A9X2JIQ0_9BACT|nr:NAD(P)H-dependent oxidoreductase subunit E [Aeoliella straminimaris]MCO6047335.1 NAD(P)H-dependent oxidoreductase subunit E [Aeoliella straminimaris]